jgi:PKD repeat protein
VLTYAWDLDGDGQTDDSTSATPSFTYTAAGDYTVTLSVSDGRGGSDSDRVVISAGNRPPVPTIDLPLDTTRFRVGDTVTLRGHASDPEDGALPDSSLRWKVTRHHGTTHTHPWLPETAGNDIPISTPGPEDWETAETSYLEIELTAIDVRGLATTVRRELRPRLVDLTFATQPSGFTVFAFASALVGPQTVTSWDGFAFGVRAEPQTDASGEPWRFSSWSDGGPAIHTVTTPASDTTYTATYVRGPSVTGFSPTIGAPGGQVTINGLGFTGVTSVTLALVKASFTVESPTRITAVVPATGVSGKWRVTTPSGTATSAANFTVSPSVTAFTPGRGPPGTRVTLAGTGFTGATQVSLALAPATFTVDSPTRITAFVPATAQSGRWRVTTGAGTATSGGIFTVG